MQKITINGKTYPCRITMGAIRRFKIETGKDISTVNTTDIADMAVFLYCCTKAACNADDVEFDYDVDKFCDSLSLDAINEFAQNSVEKKTEVKKRTKS